MSLLQTNETVLAKLVRDSPTAIVVSTLAGGQMLDVNDSFVRLVGYTRDEVIGQTSVELGLWVDPTQRAELTSTLVADDRLHDFEATVRTKTGAERQVLGSMAHVTIDDRACLLTQMIDVTDFRKVETKFKVLVEQLPVITYVHGLDESRTLSYISPQVETIVGYSPAEVLAGRSDSLIGRVHPEDRERLLNASQQTLHTLSPYRIEYRVQARDGHWVWVQDQASVVRDAHGHPLLWQGVITDITDQRHAESALRESEERFRSAFDHAATGMALVGEDGRFLQVNQSLCTILAYSEAELLDKSFAEITVAEDRNVDGDLVQQLLRGEIASYQVEKRLVCQSDEVIWGRLSMSLVRSSTNEPLYFTTQIQDITPFKATGAALRESEERFRALVQNSYDVITILDPDGTRRYISPSIERLLGYHPADLLGHSVVDLVHPDDAPRLEKAIETCLRDVKESSALELRFRHVDGSWRDFEAIGTNLLQEPSVAGIVFNSRDITPRKAAEAALRESEERFRSAFDHAPIGLALVAADGRFIQVNRALCELVGYTEQELLGKTFQDITHPDDLADDLEQAARLWAGEIDTYQLEKRYVRKDGGIIWIQLTGSTVRDANGPKYGIAQILDITGRRHLDMDRAIMLASEREYTRQLQALTEMRADLTAMIAHELRAPVAALRMMTFLLATGELSPRDEGEMFEAVKGEIDQLDRLINDVADVTSAEREDFSILPNPVPLRVLFENAATYARATLEGHPFTMPPAPDVRVWCDPERIGQVLRNLLDNAAKHTPAGTAVTLHAHYEDTWVRIEVADQGPGLPAEDVALVFEKFGRGQLAAARQTPGAGLGLYLSRQIVQAHGAELTVASVPGSGTVFAFDLQVSS